MKTIPAISIEAQELIRLLENAKVGDVIAYPQMSAVCMGDVQVSKRHVLTTARRRLLVDRHMVFEVVKNVGMMRVTDAEIVATSQLAIKKINRASRRAIQKLTCVDFDTLDQQHKVQHNTNLSALGVLSHVTSSQKIKRLNQSMESAGQRLSLKQTLAFFSGGGTTSSPPDLSRRAGTGQAKTEQDTMAPDVTRQEE